MVEVGEPFSNVVSLQSDSLGEFFAPSGQRLKLTMAFSVAQSNGEPKNDFLTIVPANGAQSTIDIGVQGSGDFPPVGTVPAGDTRGSLQPFYVTDSQGLFLTNDSSQDVDVFLQGVRLS